MGTSLYLGSVDIRIPKDKFPELLEALRRCESTPAWGDHPPAEALTLDKAFEEWRFTPVYEDETGDLTDLEWHGEKQGDEDELWKLMAPFVNDGGTIGFTSSDDYDWQVRFKDGHAECWDRRNIYGYECNGCGEAKGKQVILCEGCLTLPNETLRAKLFARKILGGA